MAENSSESSGGWLDTLISVGKGAGDIYNSFVGNESAEETAYLKGQVDTLNKQAEEKNTAGILKIGNFEIATSSILWIVGGSLGLMLVASMFKKVVR